MIEIKDLLEKFSNLILKEEVKLEVTRNTISDIIGLEIKPKDIEIKKNIIYLNIKPIYKSEILLKKEKIFSELNKVLSKKIPTDIR